MLNDTNEKIKVICIVGPTASGKTRLGARLSSIFNGEVISADSMQIYKGMDIAAAKPNEAERMGVSHHLLSFLDLDQRFSVAEYVALAKEKIDEITARKSIPFVVGGTGLYIDSLMKNIEFSESESDFEYRELLKSRIEFEGSERLLNELSTIDPEYASRLHPNNHVRIIRALELYKVSGYTMTEQIENSKLKPSAYDVCYIGINYKNRQNLYDRINARADAMIERGLLEEARRYQALSDKLTAAQAIGYKELRPYLDGEESFENALESLKRETRRYAKRQLTWFRRNKEINWIYADEYEDFEGAEAVAERIVSGFLEANLDV